MFYLYAKFYLIRWVALR